MESHRAQQFRRVLAFIIIIIPGIDAQHWHRGGTGSECVAEPRCPGYEDEGEGWPAEQLDECEAEGG